jgi:hypothetical protein
MEQLRRKGRRLAGMCVIMIGGGLLLESSATRAGAGLLAIGIALFAWGFIPSGLRSEPEEGQGRV